MKESGLYIHIPFCKNKCIYCDFFSGGAGLADWDAMTDALLYELDIRKNELVSVPDTLYIGGGTPSLIPPSCFRKLVAGINDMLGKKDRWREFTIEVNPDDVNRDKCNVWKEFGVNRVSMGVQSFVDDELKRIKRRHDSKCAVYAYQILSNFFENISLDLMFGLPGQSLDTWSFSIDKAIELNPRHISAYSLMFEDATPISVLKQQGRLTFPSDDECVSMWNMLSSRLKDSGYIQYEISNYCKPGCESIHNSRYWLGNPYLGLGPSAHSYDGLRVRRANPADLKGYLDYYVKETSTISPFYIEEYLSDDELKEEMLLTRMRMRSGIDLCEYEIRFGSSERFRLLKNAEPFIRNATLINDGIRLRLSDDGIMIADDIIVALSM